MPTFAYWKGMINPRRSVGLFDFADILPAALSLAGVRVQNLPTYFLKRPVGPLSLSLKIEHGQRERRCLRPRLEKQD